MISGREYEVANFMLIMNKKCCENCFFSVKMFNRSSDGELLMKQISKEERAVFKNLNLEKLDGSHSYKCWKEIWQETAVSSLSRAFITR